MNRTRAASLVAGSLSVLLATTLTSAQTDQLKGGERMKTSKHLNDFQVIEFRRYTIRDGERQHFAQYFESYFPEAFQQLGALALGHFFERKNQTGFTWIRAFHSME
jgi:hypothetical protein